MLQAIRSRAQGIFAWVIVGLIAIPFTLWGINNYMLDGGEAVAASVNGEEISTREFQLAFQNYTQQLRFLMGASFPEEMLDDPATKQNVIEGLVEQRLVLDAAAELGLGMSDSALSQVIRSNEAFQGESGQFDSQRYEAVLSSQGLTPVAYEARLRSALLSEQLASSLRLSAFATQQEVDTIARLRHQKREVAYSIVPSANFHDAIQVSADKVRQYYDDHPEEFRIPEQVKVHYLRLTAASLATDIPLDEQTLRNFYEESKDQYRVPERRRASHILITIPPQGDEAVRQQAQEKAEAVLERLQQGEAFEEVAKEVSEDPGSAKKGGDLGFFGRGVMDPAFEKAVFSLEETGVLSEPILSKFGYHIIKLTGIEPGEVKPFEAVREELAQKYRQQIAEEQFYEQAEILDNLTYENPFTLEVAAESLGLSVETSEPFSQNGGSGIAANTKVVAAAFSEEVLREEMNSQTIELAPNDLVVVRLDKHLPADTKPFEEVREQIQEKLTLEQAKAQAQKRGEALVADLQQGESPETVLKEEKEIVWNEKKWYARDDQDIPAEIIKLAYELPHPPSSKEPAFAGQALASGDYAVVGVYKVQNGDPSKLEEKARRSLVQEMEQVHGEMVYRDFIQELKSKADIKIYTENL
ncbi:SurA N-terminal domain-containing protein [Nitrosococcus watsonii]|uniref:Periplasmic chaperone PpiD n=1 Tax=Nitrosococcus watsoni (strain C-113) TaxID=105559 RepID=D8K5T5_NITWC|nr:SurA N-terminal domain-containing protein [Nitrosococcus watsonii]ADJ28262.1 PpiC-type peptidyl-prolyl cis-trans isomerase [Nitrosococcus watsonii C-113]